MQQKQQNPYAEQQAQNDEIIAQKKKQVFENYLSIADSRRLGGWYNAANPAKIEKPMGGGA